MMLWNLKQKLSLNVDTIFFSYKVSPVNACKL